MDLIILLVLIYLPSFIAAVIGPLTTIAVAAWVYKDAKILAKHRADMLSPTAWSILVVLLLIFAFPIYLILRYFKYSKKQTEKEFSKSKKNKETIKPIAIPYRTAGIVAIVLVASIYAFITYVDLTVKCYDPDGGLDFGQQATTMGILSKSITSRIGPRNSLYKGTIDFFLLKHSEQSREDECKRSNPIVLSEYYCADNKIEEREYECPQGCQDGACLNFKSEKTLLNRPDLIISSIYLGSEGQAPYDDSSDIYFVIQNIGTDITQDFKIEYSVNGRHLGSTTISELLSNEQKTLTTQNAALFRDENRKITLEVEVDTDKQISEADEENNTMTSTFDVD